MKKYVLTIAAIFALLFTTADAKTANAQGFHFGGGGVHVDVGYPHGGYGHYPQTTHWGGGWGGHSDWHDTTYLDYHPGGYERHYDHFNYAPGHYNVHSSGHWDRHHF